MNSWSGPSGASTSDPKRNDKPLYRALVVDSGPIIKHTGVTKLFGQAEAYYTVPAVLDEIRDAKARSHLDQWPMELKVKEVSPEAMQRVITFAKQTGDYPSLSTVDLQVLALVVDLEQEGCLSLDHLRTTPKRKIGLGNLKSLNPNSPEEKKDNDNEEESEVEIETEETSDPEEENVLAATPNELVTKPTETTNTAPQPVAANATPSAPKSWAALVNPSAKRVASVTPVAELPARMEAMKLVSSQTMRDEACQFDDAEDEEDEPIDMNESSVQEDLQSEFPSLAAASAVPYEGSDDETDEDGMPDNEVEHQEPIIHKLTEEELAAKKKQALQSVSKSGKLYNSFRKYGKLMKPAPKRDTGPKAEPPKSLLNIAKAEDNEKNELHSRIVGGGMAAEDMTAEDDDGQGWITTASDISAMKANGRLDPSKGTGNNGPNSKESAGPPRSQRAACTTTDFAMQNVLLQMGLPLVSVDGMQIRRLKSWVTRCGACFKIHTDGEFQGMKRLFCSHCGSDMMQRIAASVDGKTGRLKLHLSKKYKKNLRGTKFSLPKAGSGNRFQGDLLLREDQLLTGAWNQKVKMRSGGQSRAKAQSIFGKDIASNVGCNAKAINPDDIRVGFGRRNPNSSKGRERRGKKKKSSDRACGLRRY